MWAAACLLLASCGTTAVYQPVNFDRIYHRKAIFLDPVYLPPIKRELHDQIVDLAEAELARLDHLGGLVTRKVAKARAKTDSVLARDYELSSETISVVGVAERETAARLAKALHAELLLMVQLVFTPCPHCENGSQLALIASLVEAGTAKLLWRGHFIENFGDYTEEELETVSHDLLEEFFTAFEEGLRPKWQRLRFKNLAHHGSA